MAVNLTPPSRLTGSAEQQLNGLYSYLYQLVEALNVNMGNSTGAGGGTALYTGAQAGGLVSASGSGIDLDKASQTYQDLKALIIKTATEVTSNIRKVVTEISHEYIAQSEFGTYEEYLLNKITQGADGVLMEWNMVNGITTSVAEFEQYIAESDVFIQVGIVKYNDDGTVEAGVVIGKNLTKVTIDGKEIITSQNLYALFTAEELSFWQNGECRARYGMVEFMVEKGYIDEVTTSLLQSPTFGAQLVLREDVLTAIAANINLVANESISLIVGGSESTLRKALNQTKDSLQANIDAVDQKIKDIQLGEIPELDELEAVVEQLKNDTDHEIEELNTRLNLVPGQITAAVSQTEAKITELGNKVDANQESVTADIQQLSAELELVPGKISAEVSKTDAKITTLSNKVDANQESVTADIQQLSAELQLVPGQITAAVSKTETRIDGLEGEIDDQSKDITQMRSEIDMLPEQIRLTVESTPAKELRTGTTVTITDEMFHVSSPETRFSIPSAGSEDESEIVSIDENGMRSTVINAEYIYSPSIVNAVSAADHTPATVAELQVIFDEMSGHWMTGDVTIDASAITQGSFEVRGLHGYGHLIITGGTFNSIKVTDCSCIVKLQSNTFSVAGSAVIAYNAKIHLAGVTFDSTVGVDAYMGSVIWMDDCLGRTGHLFNVCEGSIARFKGDRPTGDMGTTEGEITGDFGTSSNSSGSGGGGGSSGGGSFTPTDQGVKSAVLTATKTRTWGDGWLSTSTFGAALYQGTVGGGALRRGCMWFDASALSGKTIVSATLTIKRYSGIGGGGSVSIGIYGTTATTDSGTPAVGSKYASADLANGATATVDVTEAVKALVAGTIKGLMIYDARTGTFDGKTYTYGYAKVYGTDTSSAPKLSVTYK